MKTKEGDEEFSRDRLWFDVLLLSLAPKSRPLHQVVHNGLGENLTEKVVFTNRFISQLKMVGNWILEKIKCC